MPSLCLAFALACKKTGMHHQNACLVIHQAERAADLQEQNIKPRHFHHTFHTATGSQLQVRSKMQQEGTSALA